MTMRDEIVRDVTTNTSERYYGFNTRTVINIGSRFAFTLLDSYHDCVFERFLQIWTVVFWRPHVAAIEMYRQQPSTEGNY